MKTLFPLLVIVFLVALYGCTEPSSNTADQQSNTTTSPATARNTPPKVDPLPNLDELLKKGEAIDFENFNKTIIEGDEAKDKWAASPFRIALKFTNDQLESRSKKIEVQSENAENQDDVLVIITEDGLLDDAVQSAMIILKMNKKDKLWQIQEARRVWKCWEGRGHGDFSSTPCL